MSEYIVVKLVSGEEVIGKQSKKFDEAEILEAPAVIVIRPGPNGEMNVMLVPLMPYAKDFKIKVPNIDNLIKCEPEEGLLNEYKKLFDPDAIIVPEKKIVLH